eukprot:gene2843-3641_t
MSSPAEVNICIDSGTPSRTRAEERIARAMQALDTFLNNPWIMQAALVGGRLLFVVDIGTDIAVLCQLSTKRSAHPTFFTFGVFLFLVPYSLLWLTFLKPSWAHWKSDVEKPLAAAYAGIAGEEPTSTPTTLHANALRYLWFGVVYAMLGLPTLGGAAMLLDFLLVTWFLLTDFGDGTGGQFRHFVSYYERLRFLVECFVENPSQTAFGFYISYRDPSAFGVSDSLLALSVTASVFSMIKNAALTWQQARRREVTFLEHVADIVRVGLSVPLFSESIATGKSLVAEYTGRDLPERDVRHIGKALQSSACQVQRLEMSGCNLQERIVFLEKGLRACSTLTWLSIA